jgi:hypothetical protein
LVTIFSTPYPFMVSTFCAASIWNRYSLPSRRAASPDDISSGPRMANRTPAALRIFASATDTFLP